MTDDLRVERLQARIQTIQGLLDTARADLAAVTVDAEIDQYAPTVEDQERTPAEESLLVKRRQRRVDFYEVALFNAKSMLDSEQGNEAAPLRELPKVGRPPSTGGPNSTTVTPTKFPA